MDQERTCLAEEAQTAVVAEEAHTEDIFVVNFWLCVLVEMISTQMGFLMLP